MSQFAPDSSKAEIGADCDISLQSLPNYSQLFSINIPLQDLPAYTTDMPFQDPPAYTIDMPEQAPLPAPKQSATPKEASPVTELDGSDNRPSPGPFLLLVFLMCGAVVMGMGFAIGDAYEHNGGDPLLNDTQWWEMVNNKTYF